LAERNGDTGLLAVIKFAYGTALGASGNMEAWVRHSEEGFQLAKQTGSEPLQAAILTGLTGGTEIRGDLRRAIELTELGISLTHGDPSVGEDILYFSPYLHLIAGRGVYMALTGRIPEGIEQLRNAIQLAREREDFTVSCTANSWWVVLANISGEIAGAVAHARAAVDAADRVGLIQRTNANAWLGLAIGLEGDWPQAASVLERCHSITVENAGLQMTQSLLLGYLARAYAHCGNPAARSTAERAVAVAQGQGVVRYEIEAQIALAQALLASGNASDRPAVDSALARAAACVEQSGARAYLPMIKEERATSARLGGGDTAAMRELREAHRLYEEIGATGHAARLAKALRLEPGPGKVPERRT
jgi:hypothetical protein